MLTKESSLEVLEKKIQKPENARRNYSHLKYDWNWAASKDSFKIGHEEDHRIYAEMLLLRRKLSLYYDDQFLIALDSNLREIFYDEHGLSLLEKLNEFSQTFMYWYLQV